MRARHLIRVWIPKTMRIGYSQRRAVVVVGGATVDFARRPTTMIIIGIVLALVGLAYLCWLLFALAVYALPLFALCGRPHKANYVAFDNMWRKGRSMLVLRGSNDSCATYSRGYNVRRKAMTSGWRDHPPVARRVFPRANVASARFFVARSVSA